jgi:hypothetical protein
LKNKTLTAMKIIYEQTDKCIKFINTPNENSSKCIHIGNNLKGRCLANSLGYPPFYENFQFGFTCTPNYSIGSIIHEFMHILGFHHEHQRLVIILFI